jgi:hypothetical protein
VRDSWANGASLDACPRIGPADLSLELNPINPSTSRRLALLSEEAPESLGCFDSRLLSKGGSVVNSVGGGW